MRDWLHKYFFELGLGSDRAGLAVDGVEVVIVALAAFLALRITQKVALRAIQKIALKTSSDWDDRLVKHKVFRRLAHVIPAIVIFAAAPACFVSATVIDWARRGAELYSLIAILAALSAVLTVGHEIYRTYEISLRFPIQVYVQGARVVLFSAAAIIGTSILTNQSPLLLLSGLGAMAAVILLITKDSIQSLVAGVQLVSNDMVRVGDWIEMPQFGADGDIVAITLPTVKVQNWDKTISMIPTYALASQSFKNWRGMSESGGRRIKRSIYLDISSIQFCDGEMLKHLQEIDLLRDFIQTRSLELDRINKEQAVTESVPVNGRRLTNVGVFRQYMVLYLRSHPKINQDLTLLVRQLQPTDRGLPLQFYAFSADTAWVAYEDVQSDIFDHVFASLPQFGLKAFQPPTGSDAIEALAPLRYAESS